MPRDTYVRIGQAAQLAGVSIDTLRRWEAERKLTAARSPGGQRSYRVADLECLRDGDEGEDTNCDAPEIVIPSPRPTPTSVPRGRSEKPMLRPT